MSRKMNLIIGIVSLPLLVYLWPTSLGGDTEFVTVNGNSMLPTITSDSLAIAKKSSDYQVGDIAVYDNPDLGRTVIHRIIAQQDDGFIFKGDNNPSKDPGIISQDKIHGKVVYVTPLIGIIPNLLKSPMIMAVILIGTAIMTFKKKEKKGEKGKKKKDAGQSFFAGAILTNVASYVLVQISISMGIVPKMDGLTNYFLNNFDPSFGSTMAFAIWFCTIIGIYFMAKKYQVSSTKLQHADNNGTLQTKEQKSMAVVFEVFYLLLTIIPMMFLIGTVRGLFPTGQ